MPLKDETLAKLTTTLASDVELYNEIINEIQTNDSLVTEKDQKIKELEEQKGILELRSNEYLGQISNLLSKIPVGNTNAPKTMDAKMKEIKERQWTK